MNSIHISDSWERGSPFEQYVGRWSRRVATVLTNFQEYWAPFLSGQSPGPAYAMSLANEIRNQLRERVQHHLPIQPDGSIRLIARAWSFAARWRAEATPQPRSNRCIKGW